MHLTKLFKKRYISMLAITAVVTLLLLLCFVFSFDAENGYFDRGALPIIFYVAYGAGAVISLLSLLIPSEFETLETPDVVDQKSKPFFLASAIATVLLGGLSFTMPQESTDLKITLGIGIGTICFGIYVIYTSIVGYRYDLLKLVFLFFSMSLPVMLGLGNNSNYYRHLNSVENILTALFSISFLVYILFESRRVAHGRHSGWHFVSMLWMLMSGASLSIAYFVAFMLDKVTESYRFYQMLIILSISAFMAFESNRFVRTLTPKATQTFQAKEPTKEHE